MKIKLLIGTLSAFLIMGGAVTVVAMKNNPNSKMEIEHEKTLSNKQLDRNSSTKLNDGRNSHDDPVNHDLNDDSKNQTGNFSRNSHHDDPATHDLNDDSKNQTGNSSRNSHHDDPANHDLNDDSKNQTGNFSRNSHHDDPVNHDLNDDNK
jgi:hypothetical protein